MTNVLPSRTLSVSVNQSAETVYDFVSDPHNLPKWASGLGESVSKSGDQWLVNTPQGAIKLRFVERNKFGVLDHYVSPLPDSEIYVPMRVVENGSGCDVTFTLFRQPDMSDTKYADDIALVERDLATLKKILEA